MMEKQGYPSKSQGFGLIMTLSFLEYQKHIFSVMVGDGGKDWKTD